MNASEDGWLCAPRTEANSSVNRARDAAILTAVLRRRPVPAVLLPPAPGHPPPLEMHCLGIGDYIAEDAITAF